MMAKVKLDANPVTTGKQWLGPALFLAVLAGIVWFFVWLL